MYLPDHWILRRSSFFSDKELFPWFFLECFLWCVPSLRKIVREELPLTGSSSRLGLFVHPPLPRNDTLIGAGLLRSIYRPPTSHPLGIAVTSGKKYPVLSKYDPLFFSPVGLFSICSGFFHPFNFFLPQNRASPPRESYMFF